MLWVSEGVKKGEGGRRGREWRVRRKRRKEKRRVVKKLSGVDVIFYKRGVKVTRTKAKKKEKGKSKGARV